MNEISFFVDPKTIKEATDNTWNTPSHAAEKGIVGEPGYRASWFETVQILDTTVVQQDENTVRFGATVQVPGDASSYNIARRHWQNFWLNRTPTKGTKQTDNNERNLRNLKSLIKAAQLWSVDYDEGGVDFAALFSKEKPLVGKTLKVRVQKYVDKTGEIRQDMDKWAKEDA